MALSIPPLKQLLPPNSFRGCYRHLPASLSSSSRLFSSAKSTLYADADGQVPREFQIIAAAETKDELYLRMLMPWLGKEDVEVCAEKDKVVVNDERKTGFPLADVTAEPDGENGGRGKPKWRKRMGRARLRNLKQMQRRVVAAAEARRRAACVAIIQIVLLFVVGQWIYVRLGSQRRR